MDGGGLTQSTAPITFKVVGDQILGCIDGVSCVSMSRERARECMSSLNSAICATAPPIDEAQAEQLARVGPKALDSFLTALDLLSGGER